MGGSPVCVVTGATGFIGSHLVEALVRRGWRVRCPVRNPARAYWLKGLPVELVTADLTVPESLDGVFTGAEVVFHLAGLTRALRPQQFFEVNVTGTANLLRALGRADGSCRKLIFLSSLAAAGPSRPGAARTEAEPPNPVSVYGKSKRLAEEQVIGASPVGWVILRPPIVYGPRDGEGLLYFRVVKLGVRPVLWAERYFSLIYVGDLVRGILLAAESPRAAGIYHIADPTPYSFRALAAGIGRVMGRPGPTLPAPGWAFRLAGRLADLVARARRRPTVFSYDKAVEMTAGDWVCDCARVEAELGFRTEVGLDQGLKITYDWYRSVGWL